jgi:aspartate racemase
MKRLGLIGGMSWESTAEYYRIINQEVSRKLGGSHSCDCYVYSFDFNKIDKLQHENKWEELANLLTKAAVSLEAAGAEIILLCTNTMHLLSDSIEKRISIPLLHIVDVVGEEITKKKLHIVGLLGTKFTMEKDFYKKRLFQSFGIEVIVPKPGERDFIHEVIYHELVQGQISGKSREQFIAIVDRLGASGAEGVILGCTEIPLIISQEDCTIPLFDTTSIHATAAVRMALEIE